MTTDISQFHQVFFEETAEHLVNMESLILGLDIQNPDLDELNAIFRAAHSIKGGSGTFGFTDMTKVTHVMESLLDGLRKGSLKLRNDMVDVFLEAGDILKNLLYAHQNNEQVDEQSLEDICNKLSKLDAPVEDEQSTSKIAGNAAEPAGYGFFSSVESETAAEDLGYGFFEDVVSEKDPGYGFFTDAPQTSANSESQGRRATDNPTSKGVKAGRRDSDKTATNAQSENSSIRVGIEKVDQLINLVGELVITQAMLSQSATDLDPAIYEKLLNGLTQLERNTRDLQESVMSIRMMPINFIFSRFPRVVREVATKLNKSVELKTIGEGTELDKGLIEKLSDPLTHLVRNSLDHGIELPAVREAAGKDPKGTVTLRASHEGGNVLIEISDDGAGLNRDKILSKARERGLPSSDNMTDQEVWQLIFEPGFSTAEVVTDVSGRGVGMDVVKRNIHAMGGRVDIASQKGWGSTITIRLPLTLAILDGMSVAVGKEIFILPLTYISESLQVDPADIKTVSGQGRVVHVRGEYIPLLALHSLFNIKPKVTEPHLGILVILESEGKKIALFVDELVGQHQVVIKSLETNYKRIFGISAATIMGDGKVALILDVTALLQTEQTAELVA